MRKAIFLDRDGTINREVNGVKNPSQLQLFPSACRAIGELNNLEFEVIVITNQGMIGRNLLSKKGLHCIHTKLKAELKKHNARLDGIYYCPHHPSATLKTMRSCTCRKPATGMIDRAIKKFSIDRHKSFFIGDATWDILAGKRAGLTTILVNTGYRGLDRRYKAKPDFKTQNLLSAVRIIKKKLNEKKNS